MEEEKGKVAVILEESHEADDSVSSGSELPFTMTTTLEDATNVPQGYSSRTNIYKRKKVAVGGASSLRNAQSEYYIAKNNMRDKSKKRTLVQRIDWLLLRTTEKLIPLANRIIPQKYNPREDEAVDTLWGRRIRENLLDRGANTRRIVAILLCLIIGFGMVFFISIIPWRTYLSADIIAEYHEQTQSGLFVVNNVLMPHYVDGKNDPSDRLRISHLVNPRSTFKHIDPEDLNRGYTTVMVEYNYPVNVTFTLIEKVMKKEADDRNLGCLCAAHVGVPLNIVWLYKKGFFYDPRMTLGSSKVSVTPDIHNSNLYYNASSSTPSHGVPPQGGFKITHPYGIALRHVAREGLKSEQVYGMNAACVVFCCELAAKTSLVGGEGQGGVLISKEGNTRKFGIL